MLGRSVSWKRRGGEPNQEEVVLPQPGVPQAPPELPAALPKQAQQEAFQMGAGLPELEVFHLPVAFHLPAVYPQPEVFPGTGSSCGASSAAKAARLPLSKNSTLPSHEGVSLWTHR